MRRIHIVIRVFCIVFLFSGMSLNVGEAQVQGKSKMVGTKHNLSTSGTGSIKAKSEGQICVFCHTPHVPTGFAADQLWNHQLSKQNYTLYSSDYLTSLNYAAGNQPNSRSKMCLSCHDGTIAIGAVYNDNGVKSITMVNGTTTMPVSSSSNLGTSLADDHPVGFVFDNTKDPELVARKWPWKTPIKLDPDAGTGTVECHTCHDPHDNTYGSFLRISNTKAAMCNFCHTKTGWGSAIHNTSTQSFTPSGGATTTLGEWSCRNCHQSHNGKGVPYLLKDVEEATCYESGCHGSTGTGANTKNIQSEMEKLYSHPIVHSKHKNPDTPTSLNVPNRHAGCPDCHNSHQAVKGLHTLQSNALSGVLTGTSGVLPGPTPSWTQTTSYTRMNPSLQENQICMKCHSSYAFGMVPNGITTIVGPSGEYVTDQAMEFNPENKSAHPVAFASTAQTGALSPKSLVLSQMTPDWNAVGTQTMYCSDCHGNDQAVSSITPQGPHGSNARDMLSGKGKYWPLSASGQLWSLADIKNNTNNWQNDLFCANCHQLYNGINFVNNVHAGIDHQKTTIRCITCHITIPHGSKRSRLIGYASDVQPYNYQGTGIYDKLVITGFQKASSATTYTVNNCSMNGVCHGTQAGFYEQ
jgi:predicted CXXCH cytochrome family protein